MKRSFFIGLAAIGAIVIASQPVMASCTKGSPAGKWGAYSVGDGQSTGPYWVKCNLAIAAGGSIGGSCSDSSGNSTQVTGSLSLLNASHCTYKGSVRYKSNGVVSNVTQATLAPNHDTASGVGTFSGGAFVFNMVRY